MSGAEPSRLARAADEAEVRAVVLRYARAVDRRDLAAVAACFRPDATYRGTLSTSGIGDALEALARAFGRYDSTMHVVANQLVDLRGDEATCESYAIAHHLHRPDGTPRDLEVAIRYTDEMTRDDGRWRIRHRCAETLWTRDGALRDAGGGTGR